MPRGRQSCRHNIDTSIPIEAIDRVDGSVWKIQLLRQVNETKWSVRWIIEGVEDSSVLDEELSTRHMRPESIGCSQKDCSEGRLQAGVPVAAYVSPPPEIRKDIAVPSRVSRFYTNLFFYDHIE